MNPRRAVLGTAVAGTAGAAILLALVATAGPAAAHGVGSRGDLPLERWQFLYAAGAALVISFLALRLLWPRARLARAATGRPLPRGVDVAVQALGIVVRVLGVAVWLLTIAAAWFGTENSRENLGPTLVYVVLWVGMQLASALLGDVWRVLSPFDTLAAVAQWVRLRRWPAPVHSAPDDGSFVFSHWPATIGIFGFVWLELCYHSPDSPRSLAIAMTAYSALLLAGAARYGRAWLRTADGFAVMFAFLASMAPFFRHEGRLHVRAPFAGLATLRARRGTIAFVCVLLGSTAFDGVGRSQWWADVVGDTRGWGRTLVNTLGIVWVIGIVAAVYVAATMAAAYLGGTDRSRSPRRFVASLVPIALGLAIAHYFSLFMIEGQAALPLLSDPFGEGWDVLGTGPPNPDYAIVTADQIAWVQVLAIVIGHVAGVVVAHDLAVEDLPHRRAVRSQYPMLLVMIGYTVGGLALLLGA